MERMITDEDECREACSGYDDRKLIRDPDGERDVLMKSACWRPGSVQYCCTAARYNLAWQQNPYGCLSCMYW